MLLCNGQELLALLLTAIDVKFSRNWHYSRTGVFEVHISALIILLPRLEYLPKPRIFRNIAP
jgi:hypothetical protein